MIELGGLTYANRAMCPAESAAPELWVPGSHFYAPVLGCSGGIVPDLFSSADSSLVGATWHPNSLSFSNSGKGDCGPLKLSCPRTVLVDFKFKYGTTTQYHFTEAAALSSGFNWATYTLGSGYDVTYQIGPFVRSGNVLSDGNDYCFVATDLGSGSLSDRADAVKLFLNGMKIESTWSGTSIFDVADSRLYITNNGYGSRPELGNIHATGVICDVLSAEQIAALSADPLLPFRRRKQRSWFPALASFRPWFVRRMEVIQ